MDYRLPLFQNYELSYSENDFPISRNLSSFAFSFERYLLGIQQFWHLSWSYLDPHALFVICIEPNRCEHHRLLYIFISKVDRGNRIGGEKLPTLIHSFAKAMFSSSVRRFARLWRHLHPWWESLCQMPTEMAPKWTVYHSPSFAVAFCKVHMPSHCNRLSTGVTARPHGTPHSVAEPSARLPWSFPDHDSPYTLKVL